METGGRHFDCAERYRNEQAVGEAMQGVFKAEAIKREDVFVQPEIWNTNRNPERVSPAFESELPATTDRLRGLLYYPYPFCRSRPWDEQDPRDEHGQVIYDSGVTALVETWRALEDLVDGGNCQIDRLVEDFITLERLKEIVAGFANQEQAAVQESSPIPISRNGTCSISAGNMG